MVHDDGNRRDPLDTSHLKKDLASRSISGSFVTLIAQGIKVLAQVMTIVLLARLLTPSDFGLFAIVVALLTVFELFKDMGLSGATVQRPTITHPELSTLFWLNAALGAAVAIILAAAAPALARFYGEPILTQIAAASAMTLVFTGLAAQHLALLRRQMRFTSLSVVQTGSEVVAMCAALIGAWSGMGVWALVLQRLVWGLCMAVGASAASGWRPGRPQRPSLVSDHIRFGMNATGAMVLGRLASSADKLAIGWFWGAAPLGFFERSQKLTMMPVQNICTPMASVALPMLSRLTDEPGKYRAAYIAVARRISMLTAPAAALAFASSETVITTVLGDQWLRAAPILSWLGLSLLYMPMTYTLSWLYMSQDRTPEMLRANAVNVSINLLALACALPFGPVAVAMAYAIGGAIIRAPFLFWYVGRTGPVGPDTFIRILYLPVLAAILGVLLIELFGSAVVLQQAAPFMGLFYDGAIAGAAALAVYLLAPDGRRTLAETLTVRKYLTGTRVSP